MVYSAKRVTREEYTLEVPETSIPIITEYKAVWNSHTTYGNKLKGAYCTLSFDPNNGNFAYNCFGVKLSSFLVKDKNGFVVGEASIYLGYYDRPDNHYIGNGNIPRVNGVPEEVNGLGIVKDSSFDIGCAYGYYQTLSYTCEALPAYALANEYFGYRCHSGFSAVGGKCNVDCSAEQYSLGNSCSYVPLHAVKNSTGDGFYCESGYAWYSGRYQCLPSCGKYSSRDSLTGDCVVLVSKDFYKHCTAGMDGAGVVIDSTTKCKPGYDYCWKGEIRTPIKLSKGVAGVFSNCTPSSCVDGYDLLGTDSTDICVKR
jgi:hypothetical protein